MNTLSQKDAFSRARTEELALGEPAVPPFLWISEGDWGQGGWLCLWLSWGRQPLSLVRRQSRSSASMSFGPPAPPGPPSAPPVFCPGWNLEEEGAASEPQKGLHWGSWTKSFTSRQQRLPLLAGGWGVNQMTNTATPCSAVIQSVMSNSLQPRGLQHNRLPCPPSPRLAQTRVHWVGDAIQPSHPLLSPSPPTFDLSQHQGLFQWVSSSHHVAKVWSFSFSISPSNEHSGLISFRMDWVDLLAVQGTLKNLVQHHSSKASILQCSAFFMVQLSHPYMTTGKTAALTRWTSDVSAF